MFLSLECLGSLRPGHCLFWPWFLRCPYGITRKGSWPWAGSQLREHTFRVYSQTLIPLGDGSYMCAHTHTPQPIHVLVHTSHPYITLFVHTHHTPYISLHTYTFLPSARANTLHTVTIYTSLVHMPGVRSHKQMTYLHHVHTYSTFTHRLPLLAGPLASTQTFPNRHPHSVFPAHTLTPSCSHPHVSPRGAPPTHCSLSWVPKGEDS